MTQEELLKALKGNSGREQVNFDLGQVGLRPTIQRGGQYNVQVQQAPQTNPALQLADALKGGSQLLQKRLSSESNKVTLMLVASLISLVKKRRLLRRPIRGITTQRFNRSSQPLLKNLRIAQSTNTLTKGSQPQRILKLTQMGVLRNLRINSVITPTRVLMPRCCTTS
jgi:hypothetical protein